MSVAKVNGININYKIEGEGEPLLLIGGWGSDLNMWKLQLPTFRKHFGVIVFDNRGAGKSDKPPGPYSMKGMADDAIGLLDYLKIDKASVLGYSMGGAIAQEIAINYPQRVTKLVLCNTACCADAESGFTDEARSLFELPPLKYRIKLLSLVFDSPILRFTEFVRRSLKSSKVSLQGYQAQGAGIVRHNTLKRLHLIKAPTLVVVGTNDRLVRKSSSAVLAARIPQAKLAEVRDGSHDMCFEKSKEFNTEIVNFLKV